MFCRLTSTTRCRLNGYRNCSASFARTCPLLDRQFAAAINLKRLAAVVHAFLAQWMAIRSLMQA